VAGILVN